MKQFLLILPLILFSACSSGPKNDGNTIDLSKIGHEDLLQKYGENDSLKEADPFVVSNGIVRATAMMTVPGDHRQEACQKMAQVQATSILVSTVQRRIENTIQLATEDSSSVQMRDLIAQSSNLVVNDFRPGKIYAEKVRVIGENGVPRSEFRCWAETVAKEAVFKRHLIESIRKQEGKHSMSAEMSKAVDAQWSRITGTENRQPAKQDE